MEYGYDDTTGECDYVCERCDNRDGCHVWEEEKNRKLDAIFLNIKAEVTQKEKAKK